MKNPNVWLRTSQYYYTTVILWIARNKLQYDSLNDRDKITTSQFSALKFNDCMDHVFSYLSEALDEIRFTWWHHQMETFSALLALCAGNSPVPGEFPAQRPVTRSFSVFFELRLNKQSWGWWFETQSRSLWRHRNEVNSDCMRWWVKMVGVWTDRIGIKGEECCKFSRAQLGRYTTHN